MLTPEYTTDPCNDSILRIKAVEDEGGWGDPCAAEKPLPPVVWFNEEDSRPREVVALEVKLEDGTWVTYKRVDRPKGASIQLGLYLQTRVRVET